MDKKEKPQKITNSTKIIIAISIVIIVAIIYFVGSLMVDKYNNDTLRTYCTSIQDDSRLSYPCICAPYTDKEHVDIEIRDKVDNICVCECLISENRTIQIPVARAKDNP